MLGLPTERFFFFCERLRLFSCETIARRVEGKGVKKAFTGELPLVGRPGHNYTPTIIFAMILTQLQYFLHSFIYN